jgi:UrcA family protein
MKRPLIAAALVATLFATPALAASDTFEMAVKFDRAAAESPQGASAEYTKIRAEVTERCAAEHENYPVGRDFATAYCTTKTMNKVIQAISSPELTKVHAARTAG